MVARVRDFIQRGTTAAKPAATTVDVGTLYFDTDLDKLQRSSGSAWEDVEQTAGGAGLGAWTSYTPTWGATSGVNTLGNGTLTGRYKALDANTYAIIIELVWGSTTSSTGTTWSFSLPTGVTSGAVAQVLAAHIVDVSVDNKIGVGVLGPSSTAIGRVIPEGGNETQFDVPMTWASGDILRLTGLIEVA